MAGRPTQTKRHISHPSGIENNNAFHGAGRAHGAHGDHRALLSLSPVYPISLREIGQPHPCGRPRAMPAAARQVRHRQASAYVKTSVFAKATTDKPTNKPADKQARPCGRSMSKVGERHESERGNKKAESSKLKAESSKQKKFLQSVE
jgi:hypothetical protein